MDQVEAEFAKDYAALKKSHLRAVAVIFRDGQKGYDPAHPGHVYTGWRNTELQGHDPAGVYAGNSASVQARTNPTASCSSAGGRS